MQKFKYQILRGNGICDDFVLSDGEMCYDRTNKKFYIGDGKNVMSKLKPFTNIVAGDDGKVYAVSVDKNGVPHAKPAISITKQDIIYDIEVPSNENN